MVSVISSFFNERRKKWKNLENAYSIEHEKHYKTTGCSTIVVSDVDSRPSENHQNAIGFAMVSVIS